MDDGTWLIVVICLAAVCAWIAMSLLLAMALGRVIERRERLSPRPPRRR